LKKEGPIRVLQLVGTLGMGGAETWLMEVLRIWSRTGAAQMDFVATSGNTGVFDAEAKRLGAQISYLRYGRRQLPAFVREFRALLRRGRYDALHDHQDYASGWHFLMGAGALPPVRVTHVHNAYRNFNDYGISRSRRMTAAVGKRLIAHYATHIAGTSRRVINDYGFESAAFEGVAKGALHCGFDPSRFIGDRAEAHRAVRREFGFGDDALLVLFVGRADPPPGPHAQTQKNSAFAVSVAIESARADDRVCMLFAGARTPLVPVLEQRIEGAGLADRIRFVGVRTDIERLMLASDVLLFPSRGEGLGMVAVEAQAAGLPVLASTAVPRECVVVPGLVRFRDPDDGVASWAADLLSLAARPRDISAANRQVAASAFSIEHSCRALLRLYGQGVLG
jgi:glycosyltransferase involved in cell wall biosynthesis